jgi:hypothetical protein
MKYVDKSTSTNRHAAEAQILLNWSKHYNENDEVKRIIRKIYSNCCAFCECSPEDGSFFQIEHFYPKTNKKYKIFIKRIENLHYSCQRCNTLKGRLVRRNIFSPNYYLDSKMTWQITNRNKIETELFYIGHLLYSTNANSISIDRGQETIKLFDLNNLNSTRRCNRQFLVESRLRVHNEVYNVINAIYELLFNYSPTSNKAIQILFSILVNYTDDTRHYSTMTLHNYGESIYKLLYIFTKIKS